MKLLTSVVTLCIVAIVGFLMVGEALRCDHEETGTIFSFQPENSTSSNYTQSFCKECRTRLEYSNFRGIPQDTSYLEVLKSHSDCRELVTGEYYTVTATVILGDYSVDKTILDCKVENEDIIISFSVEFRDGFEEAVELIEEDSVITFRGKLCNERGLWFTDCELITEVE